MALVDNPRLRERGNLESLLGRLQLSIIDIPPDGNWCGQKSAVIDFLSLVLKRFLPSLIYLISFLSSSPSCPQYCSLSLISYSLYTAIKDQLQRRLKIEVYIIPEQFSVVAKKFRA